MINHDIKKACIHTFSGMWRIRSCRHLGPIPAGRIRNMTITRTVLPTFPRCAGSMTVSVREKEDLIVREPFQNFSFRLDEINCRDLKS